LRASTPGRPRRCDVYCADPLIAIIPKSGFRSGLAFTRRGKTTIGTRLFRTPMYFSLIGEALSPGVAPGAQR